jgi:hypothetical protein
MALAVNSDAEATIIAASARRIEFLWYIDPPIGDVIYSGQGLYPHQVDGVPAD